MYLVAGEVVGFHRQTASTFSFKIFLLSSVNGTYVSLT